MRRVLALLLPLALVASPAAASVKVWLAGYSSTGLNADEDRRMRERVVSELSAAGALDAGAELDASCLERADCVASRLSRLDASLALEVRLVRAGPLLQVSTLAHRPGQEVSRQERLVQTEELAGSATLLPEPFLQELAREVRQAAQQDPPPSSSSLAVPTPSASAATGEGASSTSPASASAGDSAPSPARAPEEDDALPVLGIAGLGLAAAGLVVAVLGGAVGAAGNEVLLDPSTSSDEKAQASFYGPFAIGAAVVGGVVAVAGGALAVVGLWDLE